jgi:hypothetical protein
MDDAAAAVIVVRVYLVPDGPAVCALEELSLPSA